MKRHLVFLLALSLCPGFSFGTPILDISPEQIQIPPGSTGSAELHLSEVTALSGFYVEVTIIPHSGTTGGLSFTGASGDQDTRYCFYGFNDQLQAVPFGGTLLAIGDQTAPASMEVATKAGVNDLVATVVLSASADAYGYFELTISRATLELFDSQGSDIPDFAQTQITGATVFVPEPATALLLVVPMAFLPQRGRQRVILR